MVQPSIIALGASLFGIVLQNYGADCRAVSIVGTACIMGAFVIAFTEFVLFVRETIVKSHRKGFSKSV